MERVNSPSPRRESRAEEAQWQAYLIAHGPAVFMVARVLSGRGFLAFLRENAEGVTEPEALDSLQMSPYAGRQLLHAALCSGMLEKGEDARYRLSKVGWFLESDQQLKVNADFMYWVNYRGFYHMEEALVEGKPAGLKTLGPWNTVYEGLSELGDVERESWLAFDHLYSDLSFAPALTLLLQRKEATQRAGVGVCEPFTLLDIGGNTGRWAMRCVQAANDIEVTVCDLPGQIAMMEAEIAGQPGAERVRGHAVNLLDDAAVLPQGPWRAVWMSQFLDCFSIDQGVRILQRAARVMDAQSRLYILEPLWDCQRYRASSMCLSLMSLYFTVIANGNSGFFHSSELLGMVARAGLEVVHQYDGLGVGHTLLEVKLAQAGSEQ